MTLRCHRCGISLAALSLPLTRLDECPDCNAQLHVCRLCVCFDATLPTSCSEEDAPEVRDKKSANFCDYFKPSPDAYTPGDLEADRQARTELDVLFSDASSSSDSTDKTSADTTLGTANELFKN